MSAFILMECQHLDLSPKQENLEKIFYAVHFTEPFCRLLQKLCARWVELRRWPTPTSSASSLPVPGKRKKVKMSAQAFIECAAFE